MKVDIDTASLDKLMEDRVAELKKEIKSLNNKVRLRDTKLRILQQKQDSDGAKAAAAEQAWELLDDYFAPPYSR